MLSHLPLGLGFTHGVSLWYASERRADSTNCLILEGHCSFCKFQSDESFLFPYHLNPSFFFFFQEMIRHKMYGNSSKGAQ